MGSLAKMNEGKAAVSSQAEPVVIKPAEEQPKLVMVEKPKANANQSLALGHH